MSPSKFQDSEVTKGVINGPRPSPLRINKDSHSIHKPSSSSSSHQPVIENSGAPKHHSLSAKRQPVIIYTHSPKVIHAQARDFMALVQKLTGLSRSEDEKTVKSESESTKDEGSFSEEKDCGVKNVGYEDNESSSVLTDEKFGGEVKQDSSAVSPMYKVSNPYLVDAPLFTPNSSEFFCSSRPNSLFQSPSMANSISPSFMDFMKGFPEY
ncbi:hypothetical protein Pfo_023743 [Paulownia fortunei]|nr:hypothetical protein Pfo_023743 [Paulownia fortunei]